jgi:hypothetical protein
VTAVGRHAAPPTGRRDSARPATLPPRRISAAVAGTFVGLSAAGFAVLAVLAVVLLGVDLLPRGAVAAAPTPSPTPTASLVRAALRESPAQQVLVAALDPAPATGWTRASALTWTSGTPFDERCGRPATAEPALAASRIYSVGPKQYVVSMSAFSAGQGPVALAAWARTLATCGGGEYAVATPGTEALVAWVRAGEGKPGAAALFWRRGDVVAVVATPGSSPTGLAERAAEIDAGLLAALAGRCVTVGSALADAARSPWGQPDTFTGLTVPVAVTVAPSPTPTPPVGVTPVPDTFTPAPAPSVSFPVRPLDPVWPEELPSPLASPLAPVAPPVPPAAITVPRRITDPLGPGCGWAFTGQVAPELDLAVEEALVAERVTQARAGLVAGQQQWQADLVAYWSELPAYLPEAEAFAAYASEVARVAAAWDTITAQRDAYAAALAAFDQASLARSEFFIAQAAAQQEYDAAVLACGLAPSAPPSPTPTPTPTVSAPPTPGVSPVPTSTPICPPAVPPILFETAPTLPPVPTPPPDPRPSPLPS